MILFLQRKLHTTPWASLTWETWKTEIGIPRCSVSRFIIQDSSLSLATSLTFWLKKRNNNKRRKASDLRYLIQGFHFSYDCSVLKSLSFSPYSQMLCKYFFLVGLSWLPNLFSLKHLIMMHVFIASFPQFWRCCCSWIRIYWDFLVLKEMMIYDFGDLHFFTSFFRPPTRFFNNKLVSSFGLISAK